MSAIVKQPTRAAQVVCTNSSIVVFEPSILYIANGGSLRVVCEDRGTIQFQNVPTGTILPIKCIRVSITGTAVETQTGIIRLF